ncbi:MAG: fibronectin type III domain-containing protein, partial [Candidatus Woesearchaeota archaeon]
MICSFALHSADGVIDYNDLNIIKNALWSVEGDPNYIPAADLNNDGVVDDKDLANILRAMGKSVGEPGYELWLDIYSCPPTPVTLDISDTTWSSVTLNWSVSNDTDFSNYQIYYSTDENVDTTSILADTITNRNNTSIIVSGLTELTQYYFIVYVSDTGGNLAASNIVTITTPEFYIEMILVEPDGGNPHGIEYDYYIGKYPITNEEYAFVLNWAKTEGYIANGNEDAYADVGTITDRISWNGTA